MFLPLYPDMLVIAFHITLIERQLDLFFGPYGGITLYVVYF